MRPGLWDLMSSALLPSWFGGHLRVIIIFMLGHVLPSPDPKNCHESLWMQQSPHGTAAPSCLQRLLQAGNHVCRRCCSAESLTNLRCQGKGNPLPLSYAAV